MAGVNILLADGDEQYLLALVRKFIEGFENDGDIEMISDAAYLEEYFQTPRSLDIVVIQEEMYRDEFGRHNIGNLFLLTEDEPDGSFSGKEIYKYTNTDTIYKQVVNNLTSATAAHIRKQGGTRIVYVYSPAGGSGKTTVAAGISSVLAKSNQRTLFLSMDELQAFGWMMTEPRTMPAEVEKQLMFQSSFVYNLIKPHLVKQDFYMMPPFTRMLSSLNIREDSFVRLLETIVAAREFDYIVVDGAAGFSETVSRIMIMSQHILIIAQQDEASRYKMSCLLNNLDCSDDGRFIFICNKYEPSKENRLGALEKEGSLRISEYIPRDNSSELLMPEAAGQMKSLQRIAYMFM